MNATAGDRCCYCGDKLVSDGERVFCVSRDDDDEGGICVGYIRPQEDVPKPTPEQRAVGRKILDNLEDRRSIKHAFHQLRHGSRMDQLVYAEIEGTIGRIAWEEVRRQIDADTDRMDKDE